ncbi:MAG: SDR family NAD(P)-dependent oxidoreductase [Alphaproteobacteria bacterium]|nr:MAG: SDR family NAD(P)-dependent oxidoreductase [Alphaproteobacteria bacterium]
MTEPLPRPKRKNPQARTRSPTRPPELRSRAALGLTAAAAEGRFALQRCAGCGGFLYPPRDACAHCLSTDLRWTDADPMGELLAETTVHVSPRLYFRERAPWRVGTVALDAGPVILAHLHPDLPRRARVRIEARLDRSGQAVLVALPQTPTPHMEEAPLMRELSADPRHRRVLIADARAPNAAALAAALRDAGAAEIFAGEAEGWRSHPGRAALEALGVHVLPLDVTDTSSVRELAGEIGGKTDILIANARFIRPGGALARADTAFARDEIEVNYLGLMRLAQAFGPAMCARTADGINSAVAWVNILSVNALSAAPEFGGFCASQAAAHSLSQTLRAEFRDAGLRVMNVYTGPTEDDWHQPLPPPKVTPEALARATIDGLKRGLEDVWCGDIACDFRDRFRRDPRVLERETTMGGEGP